MTIPDCALTFPDTFHKLHVPWYVAPIHGQLYPDVLPGSTDETPDPSLSPDHLLSVRSGGCSIDTDIPTLCYAPYRRRIPFRRSRFSIDKRKGFHSTGGDCVLTFLIIPIHHLGEGGI